jgi:hypothetical protein
LEGETPVVDIFALTGEALRRVVVAVAAGGWGADVTAAIGGAGTPFAPVGGGGGGGGGGRAGNSTLVPCTIGIADAARG